jgi:hypothetical protein
MLIIKTTKEVQTSLHTDETHKLVFKFTYERRALGMVIKVQPYKVDLVGEEEVLSIVPSTEVHRNIGIEELTALMTAAIEITPSNDNPLAYMDALVASGIKIVITTEDMWKNHLTLADFE